jgi:hypothetical protein
MPIRTVVIILAAISIGIAIGAALFMVLPHY